MCEQGPDSGWGGDLSEFRPGREHFGEQERCKQRHKARGKFGMFEKSKENCLLYSACLGYIFVVAFLKLICF